MPRSYYKKRSVPKQIKIPSETRVATIGGPAASASAARRAMWFEFAEDLVMISRATHINAMVDRWSGLRAQGHLDQDVAIIVDGSPSRPIKNVKLGGTINVQALVSVDTLLEAAQYAWATLLGHAGAYPNGPDYALKKRNNYSYEGSFEMFVSDQTHMPTLQALGQYADAGKFTKMDWVSFHNYVPYAAKLERYRYPMGTFVYTFKKLRARYGHQLAIRFDYAPSTMSEHNMTSEKGASVPTMQPVLRIGQPGAFPSRMAPMKKIIRDAKKRGRS